MIVVPVMQAGSTLVIGLRVMGEQTPESAFAECEVRVLEMQETAVERGWGRRWFGGS